MKTLRRSLLLSLVAVLALATALFAAACSKKVVLSFVTGEGSAVSSVQANAGEDVTLPASSLDGYSFEGWTLSEDGSGEVLKGSIKAPEEDTAYYAKFSKLYTLSLDGDGGQLGLNALQLTEGANVFEALAGLAPSKSGLSFGAWFDGETEVTSSYRMPAKDVTLKARYLVEYRVEKYLQNINLNAYLGSDDVIYGKDYVGKTVSPEAPAVTGFVVNDDPSEGSPVSTRTLSEHSEENIFKFYYDRLQCSVLYDANAPRGSYTGSVAEQGGVYESVLKVADNGFTRAGYRFAGWSRTENGEVDFLVNADITLTGDIVLYAVWDRGYTDRFGGNDLIFFPRLTPDVAILLRGGQEFIGERDGNDFHFVTPNGTELNGRVSGTSYSYERDDLVGEYTFYDISYDPAVEESTKLHPERTIVVDNYMNAVHQNGNHTCTGSVVYSYDSGDYVFTSDDESFRFLPGSIGDNDHVFFIGGSEMNGYIDFIMMDSETGMGYFGNSMVLVLDGYGTAALLDATNFLTYDGHYYVEGVYLMGAAELYKIVCFFTDTDGYLTGTAGAIATNRIYTVPIEADPEFDGFVVTDEYAGDYEYAGSDGSLQGTTLTLDGFGIFADSVVCKQGDKTLDSGKYSVSSDLMSGTVVIATYQSGDSKTWKVDLRAHTFTEASASSGNYVEYRRMDGNSLKPPFLIVYDEDVKSGSTVLGKRTEVWMPTEDESEIVKVASGYCTSAAIGASTSFSRYTFVRTSCEEGYEHVVPTQIVFYGSTVISAVDYKTYHTYSVLEETVTSLDSEGHVASKTRKYSTQVNVAGGGEIIVCSSVTANGLGSLYLFPDGSVVEGQFTWSQGEYFNDELAGTFVYATEQGDIFYLYYSVSENDDGSLTATPKQETEHAVYVVPVGGAESGGFGSEMVFTNGNGRVKYTNDTGKTYVYGTYEEVDTTRFGEAIYSFKVGGEERFRFVIYHMEEFGDDVYLCSKFDEVLRHEEYTAANGARFRIDNYHLAEFTDANGRTYSGYYTRNLLGSIVTFNFGSGSQFVLFVQESEGTFEQTDWATGRTWQILDNNYEPVNNFLITFDGKGGCQILTSEQEPKFTGTYLALGTYYEYWGNEQYIIDVNLGKGYGRGRYLVTFAINSDGVGACLLHNDDADGLFLDDEWNVLVLDGYGLGTLVTSAFTGNGTYTVIDFEKNFLEFDVEDEMSAANGEVFYLLLDGDSFVLNDYSKIANAYFAEDFASIVFGADGTAYIGTTSGPYYEEDGKVYIYTGSEPIVLDAPSGDTYSYANKTYYRWDGNQMQLNGTVLMREKNGELRDGISDLSATLTFTPNRTTNSKLAAVITVNGGKWEGEYKDFTLTMYSGVSFEEEQVGSSSSKMLSPVIIYGRNSYPIKFSMQNGVRSFSVTAGANSVEYLDHNARYYYKEEGKALDGSPIIITRGARLYKTSFGFGPIVEGGVTISGDILYLYDEKDPAFSEPIHFDGIPEEEVVVVGKVPSYGERKELTFSYNGTEYALDYYEYYQGGVYFWCYGFYSVKHFEADGYEVGVKTLLYTKMSIAPAYTDAQDGTKKALGEVTGVTLKLASAEAPIVAYDTGVVPNGYGEGVWVVDMENVLEHGTTGTCSWGKGYLITFDYAIDESVTGVHVKEYSFLQVVNLSEYLLNFFIDESGEMQLVGFAVFNADWGRYDWLGDPHNFMPTGENSWKVSGTRDGKSHTYTITAKEAEDVTFEEDGETYTKPAYDVTVTES